VAYLAEATARDIDPIGALVSDVWGQEILPEVAGAQIRDERAALWVARRQGDVVGFVSAFLTVGAAGWRRWEVDLLAVRPGHQGQGIGTRLIQQADQEAHRHGAALARAALRVVNVPSQRAFQKAGFSTDGSVHQLLLWSPQPDAAPEVPSPDVLLLPVETLTYRGLWIEGLARVPAAEQHRLIATARAIVADEGRLHTGALIPARDAHRLAPGLRSEADIQGEYQWLVKGGT
jgi:GNAT superfamily N-acetyltransferase